MFATGVNPDSRRIAVVGSLNIDTFLPVERNPLPGESVLSGPVSRRAGGKGANQAVGCARLGHQVSMVGCLG
jgi:ribokinase